MPVHFLTRKREKRSILGQPASVRVDQVSSERDIAPGLG
jgi:hypothetical protein